MNIYEYKGKQYRIFAETKMKVNDEWIDCIIYQTLYYNEDGWIWVRSREEFFKLFKPQLNQNDWKKGKRYGEKYPTDGTSGTSAPVRIPFDKIAYCIKSDDYYGFTKDKSYEVFWHCDGGIGSIENDDNRWVIDEDCWCLFVTEEEYKSSYMMAKPTNLTADYGYLQGEIGIDLV